MQKTLWTIRSTRQLTLERWQRFIEKARAAGTTPARVLETFIIRFTEPDYDPDRENQNR